MAYTRAVGCDRLVHEAYAVADENGRFNVVSTGAKAARGPLLVNLIFSVQGAQWPVMGKELIETGAAFRGCIADMDAVLRRLRHPPS